MALGDVHKRGGDRRLCELDANMLLSPCQSETRRISPPSSAVLTAETMTLPSSSNALPSSGRVPPCFVADAKATGWQNRCACFFAQSGACYHDAQLHVVFAAQGVRIGVIRAADKRYRRRHCRFPRKPYLLSVTIETTGPSLLYICMKLFAGRRAASRNGRPYRTGCHSDHFSAAYLTGT